MGTRWEGEGEEKEEMKRERGRKGGLSERGGKELCPSKKLCRKALSVCSVKR